MTKKFDPAIIDSATPSGGLQPYDFMRPMPEDGKEPPQGAREPTPPRPRLAAPTQAQAKSSDPEQLPMPPSRETLVRVQLGARVSPELAQRAKRFQHEKNVSLQDLAEYALDEWLTRRGF
jgi:hypothetical protein